MAIGDQRYGAMINAGRHRFDPSSICQRDCLVRRRVGRDIDVIHRHSQQAVPNASADSEGLMTSRIEHRENALGGGVCQPVGGDGFHGLIRSASDRKIRAVAPQM